MSVVSERPEAAAAGASVLPSAPASIPDAARRSPAASAQWQQLADAVTARATRQALAVPGIRKAMFSIGGTADAPILVADVQVRRTGSFSRAVDEVMERVVPDMERCLGHRFAENHVDFDVSGPCASRPGAPALSIH